MVTCPTLPKIPEDVKCRFASMRSYDARFNAYAVDLCNQVQSLDGTLSGTLTTVTDHETRITDLETEFAALDIPDEFEMPDHLIQSNEIGPDEVFEVPEFWNMVNAGPYTIQGVLEVEGTAHFI